MNIDMIIMIAIFLGYSIITEIRIRRMIKKYTNPKKIAEYIRKILDELGIELV